MSENQKTLFIHMGMSRAASTFLQKRIFAQQTTIPAFGKWQKKANGKDGLFNIGSAMHHIKPKEWLEPRRIEDIGYLERGGCLAGRESAKFQLRSWASTSQH